MDRPGRCSDISAALGKRYTLFIGTMYNETRDMVDLYVHHMPHVALCTTCDGLCANQAIVWPIFVRVWNFFFRFYSDQGARCLPDARRRGGPADHLRRPSISRRVDARLRLPAKRPPLHANPQSMYSNLLIRWRPDFISFFNVLWLFPDHRRPIRAV